MILNIRTIVGILFVLLGIGLTVAVFTVAGCGFTGSERSIISHQEPALISDAPIASASEADDADEPNDSRLGQAGPGRPAPNSSSPPTGGQPAVGLPSTPPEQHPEHHPAGALTDNPT